MCIIASLSDSFVYHPSYNCFPSLNGLNLFFKYAFTIIFKFIVTMHQKSQEDDPMTDGEQWSESRTRTANAQLTAGDVNSPRNGDPNREFEDLVEHIITSRACARG